MDRSGSNRYTDRPSSGMGNRGVSSGRGIRSGTGNRGAGSAGQSARSYGASPERGRGDRVGSRGGSSGRGAGNGSNVKAGGYGSGSAGTARGGARQRVSGTGTARRGGSAGRSTSAGSSRYAGKQGGASGRSRRSGRKGRRGGKSIFPVLVILLIVLIAGCGTGAYLLLEKGGSLRKTKEPLPEVSVDLETLDSPYAVLMDQATGTVIGSKNSDQIIFPASMVKIMTVLTAIENIGNLDEKITMSYDYYDELYERDASRAGFEPGEEAVIRDLLYGALLPSGAECCKQLALQAARGEDAFVELMNQKARSLGLTQTHFTNATGLHNDDQYSTVTEIGKILRAAVENKTFYQVFTTHSYTVGPTSVHPEGFTFWSTMFKNMQSSTVINGEILGGKTGYTDEAGHCLASMAEINGRPYILVTAGWATNPRVDQYHINDAFLGYNALGRAVEQ